MDVTQSTPAAPWQGVLNQVLYGLVYAPRLDDETARTFALRMLEWRVFTSGPEVYHDALTQAVRERHLLGPQALTCEHDEAAVRDFCARVLAHLAAARPWPAEPFARLPAGDFYSVGADRVPVALAIRAGLLTVSARVWQVFDFLRPTGVLTPVLAVRQRSGEVLGLVVGTGSPVARRSTYLTVLDGHPAAAVASFLDLTGLTPQAEPVAEQSLADATWGQGAAGPAEQELFRVFVADGRLWRADTGLEFDTSDGTSLRPGPPRAIFVLDRQANLYASLVETIGEFHHSSLLAGRPVAAAGEIVVSDGVLLEISGRCPTYRVGGAEVATALAALADEGLPTGAVTVR